MDAKTVGAVATLTGVSVRTLLGAGPVEIFGTTGTVPIESKRSTTATTRCSACLVEMYLADERFTRVYDDVEPGLAQFLHDIVVESLST